MNNMQEVLVRYTSLPLCAGPVSGASLRRHCSLSQPSMQVIGTGKVDPIPHADIVDGPDQLWPHSLGQF